MMAVIRKEKETRIIEREKAIRICDICGEDATDRVPCCICHKDLCPKHQIDVSGIRRIDNPGIEFFGIYCKDCLIKEIERLYD